VKRTTGAIGAVAAALTVLAPTAAAKDGDIEAAGTCTRATTSELKLSDEDGAIEVEFEVDQNRVGRQWRVRLTDNDDVFFRGIRTTQAPSGSFSVDRTTRNRTGDDRLVGRAVNLNSGEVCRGVLVTR
jgi:hypothetical protein